MRRFEPVVDAWKMTLAPSEYPTEFEVQAEAYHLFKVAGFKVRGEVRAVIRFPYAPSKKARIDLAVYVGEQLLALVEVKDRPITHTFPVTRQGKMYRRAGVPLFVVWDAPGIYTAVETCHKMRVALGI